LTAARADAGGAPRAARRVQRVVLSGAGFAGYGDAIAAHMPGPVIDSVYVAARALLALRRTDQTAGPH